MGTKKHFAVSAALLLQVPVAFSAEVTFTAGAELEWTDNAFLTDNNRKDDLLETIRLGVAVDESDSWYHVRVGYEAAHERYEQDSFDQETYYTGDASLLLIPIQDRFDWLSSIASTTTQTRSIQPDTPDNRDQRTIYSTAPTIHIISLQRDTVSLTADANKVDYRDEDGSDSDRLGGSIVWQHLISQLTTTSVEAGYVEADFEVERDYDREYYTVGFTRQINGGSVSLSAGQTRLKPFGGDEFDGLNLAAVVNWTNNAHAFLFDLHHDLTDTSIGFLDVTDGSQDYLSPTDVNTADVDLVTRTVLTISDTYTINSTTSLYGSVYGDQEETEAEENESTRVGGAIGFRRSLTQEIDATAEYRYEVSEDGPTEIEGRTNNINLGLNKRFGEQLALRLWVEREESDSELDALDYEVHTVGASLTAEF